MAKKRKQKVDMAQVGIGLAVVGLLIAAAGFVTGAFNIVANSVDFTFTPNVNETDAGDTVQYTTDMIVRDDDRNIEFKNLQAFLIDPNMSLNPSENTHNFCKASYGISVLWEGETQNGDFVIKSQEWHDQAINNGFASSYAACTQAYLQDQADTEVSVQSYVIDPDPYGDRLALKGSFAMPEEDKKLLVYSTVRWDEDNERDWFEAVYTTPINAQDTDNNGDTGNGNQPLPPTNNTPLLIGGGLFVIGLLTSGIVILRRRR